MEWQIIGQHIFNGISLGGVYALEAVGFGIVFNILKFSNFSHGGIVAISAYLGFFLTTQVMPNLVITLIITMLAGCIIGITVEKLIFRPIRLKKRPLTYFFVNSITVAIFVQKFFSAMWGDDFYPYPELIKETALEVGQLVLSKTYLIMFGISLLVLILLTVFLKKTKLGIAIRAASSDIWTPSLMGINTDTIVSITFGLAGLLAGLTGYFLGMTYTVTPFIGGLILKGIIAAVIGGMGSLGGGVIAGILLGTAESILMVRLGAALTPIVIYLAVIVLLLVRPQGISGKLYAIKA